MNVEPERLRRGYEVAKAALLAEMVRQVVSADDPVQSLLEAPVSETCHWVGKLSNSALATATAVMALEQVRRQFVAAGRDVPEEWTRLIRGGIEWLIAHQNPDGGWGDTVKSVSNISTTMLCHALLKAVESRASNVESQTRWSSDESITEGCQPLAGGRSGAQTLGTRTNEHVHPGGMPATDDSGIPPGCDTHSPSGPGVCAPLRPPANSSQSLRDKDDHEKAASVLAAAEGYIDKAGGLEAVLKRYGKDRTFSVPILTHCALAGLVDWEDVISLPFELACIPARFYAAVRLPVVSYALPALIAIGQVRFHFRPSRNPLRRWLQRWAKPVSLQVLERIQPPNGGFLEATPLTSFVTMSLAAMGLIDHPVTRRGVEFIVASARWEGTGDREQETGGRRQEAGDRGPQFHVPCLLSPVSCPLASWPIDTNLATWVTTLSINALGDDVPLDARPGLRAWLLRQQYRVVHPYTNAAPGGWAWTDLPGGVPDGDDTPGAMLALINLWGLGRFPHDHWKMTFAAAFWLLELQNRDGGWPTFCRGWGTLPFDRSSPDISAHSLRALSAHLDALVASFDPPNKTREFFEPRLKRRILAGFEFLKKAQRPDGSWLPLWFGNQHAPNDESPTYGTAKVLAAFQALGRMSDESAQCGLRWLVENQNPDGGWGAGLGTPSSVEETALAVEALLGSRESRVESPEQDQDSEFLSSRLSTLDSRLSAGLSWLIARVEDGRFREPAPIGFYFAKLWYFEALYPLIFTVAALRGAVEQSKHERQREFP